MKNLKADRAAIEELGEIIADFADGSGAGGMRIEFKKVVSALGGDELLARRVLLSASFRPPQGEVWVTRGGEMAPDNVGCERGLMDQLIGAFFRLSGALR